MFFRLTTVDELPLPCRVCMTDHEYEVTHGGLLLEPPSRSLTGELRPDGYSVLKLLGNPSPDGDSGLIVASSEAYRLDGAGRINISRRESDLGARFRGLIEGEVVRLLAEPGGFLRPGSELTLAASPHDPIPDSWANTFDFGPPFVEPVEPWRRNDPAARAEIARAIAAAEPDRLRAVRERLESAWRAPA